MKMKDNEKQKILNLVGDKWVVRFDNADGSRNMGLCNSYHSLPYMVNKIRISGGKNMVITDETVFFYDEESREKQPLLFRFHRGSLEDSMETVMEIKSVKHFISHMKKYWFFPFEKVNLQIRKYRYDERIDWDTFLVTLSGIPVGFFNRHPGLEYEFFMEDV